MLWLISLHEWTNAKRQYLIWRMDLSKLASNADVPWDPLPVLWDGVEFPSFDGVGGAWYWYWYFRGGLILVVAMVDFGSESTTGVLYGEL